MISLREYFEFDPRKKDLKWATEIIWYLRQHMDFLVNPKDAKENMEYLLGQQDLKFVEKLFKNDGKDSGIEFIPLKVYDKIRKILISEMENAGIEVGLQCVDPTASADKKKDRQLLSQKNFIEAHLTELQQGIGLPAYNIKNAKQEDGKPVFKGNVDRFEEMGLNVNNDDDLDTFFQIHHRLRHEVKGEALIKALIKYNELVRFLPKYMNDILAKNAIGMRVNVNEMAGGIDAKYLAPETIKVIMGRREDGKDAKAVSYEQNMSVGDFLGLVGDEFNYETDMMDLLRAVNYASQVEFTGVTADGNVNRSDGTKCSIQNFMQQYSVTVGYIEWKSVNATGYKITKANFHENPNMIKVNFGDQEGANSSYKREYFYNEVTYKSYYLSFSPSTHKLYKWGLLPYQQREGSQDELSGYSIIFYKDIGESAVSIGKYYVKLLEKAFKKMDWMINKAKPPGRGYYYPGLVDLAESLFSAGTEVTKVKELINMFVTNNYELWMLPKDENGNNVGGSGMPNYDIKNGLSEAALQFWEIAEKLESKINDQFGMTPLRQAEAPKERDGLQLGLQSLQASRTATQYANRMCMYLFNDMGTRMLSYSQDVINFRDKVSRPYKFLLDLLGYETMDDLADLHDVCFHRYGLFVESLTLMFDRKEVLLEANMAFQQQQITYEQLLLIRTIESPKMVMYTLAYAKRKTQRENEQIEKQKNDAIMQQKQAEIDGKMQLQAQKGKDDLANSNAMGEWAFKAAEKTADTNLEIAKLKIDNKPAEIAAKKDANIEEHAATAEAQ